jgi:plasmid maintenance system antidote protein VapI
MVMKERIIQIMNTKGLSSSKFAEEIGIQRAAMSHIINERNKPSADVLVKILTRFQDINAEWLLRGIGNMKRNTPVNQQVKQPDLFTNVTSGSPKEMKLPDSRKESVTETESKKNVSPNNPLPIDTAMKEIVHQKTTEKRIKQIMIFFSDNTYEICWPEKKE